MTNYKEKRNSEVNRLQIVIINLSAGETKGSVWSYQNLNVLGEEYGGAGTQPTKEEMPLNFCWNLRNSEERPQGVSSQTSADGTA